MHSKAGHPIAAFGWRAGMFALPGLLDFAFGFRIVPASYGFDADPKSLENAGRSTFLPFRKHKGLLYSLGRKFPAVIGFTNQICRFTNLSEEAATYLSRDKRPSDSPHFLRLADSVCAIFHLPEIVHHHARNETSRP
jgi:hypothetical protein